MNICSLPAACRIVSSIPKAREPAQNTAEAYAAIRRFVSVND
jgi:hypothetical protein